LFPLNKNILFWMDKHILLCVQQPLSSIMLLLLLLLMLLL
jgi:hypothetical protein